MNRPPQPTESERASFGRILALAKEEDLGAGDLTSDLLPAGSVSSGSFVARQELVFAGGVFLEEIARAYGHDISTEVTAHEGDAAGQGKLLARWSGPSRQVLPAERVALNFLQRLSGIATLTRRYVDAVEGTGARIYDTRKTTPGWRDLEKYAVRVGGGFNHRRGLYDAVLIKDNHLSAARRGGLEPIQAMQEAIGSVRCRLGSEGFVEMEVDTLEQLELALQLDLDVILLDNMGPDLLTRAVRMRNETVGDRIALEASGGVNLQTVESIARCGVERIAIGAVTHSATAVDIGLDDS
jgi:nicotinate-nucleotide pyrophosphorylase (carboxylating)